MSVYKGRINLIGEGEWQTKISGGGYTKITVLEIGDQSIRKVKLPDYLSNYLCLGEYAIIYISKGLMSGKIIEAIEVNGKKYKQGMSYALANLIGKSFIFCLFFLPILEMGSTVLRDFKFVILGSVLVAIAVFISYQIKKFQSYLRF